MNIPTTMTKTAANAAIEDRNVTQKYQVAGKQHGATCIEHREIAVAVRSPPRFERKRAVAQVQLRFIGDSGGWGHDLDLVKKRAHRRPK